MFVYIIHFNTPLHHAQHYVGSTEQLERRLRTHASGHGSKITAYLAKHKKGWQIGALLQCGVDKSRKIEMKLKEQKNAHRYCSICSDEPMGFEETNRYDLSLIPFPTDYDSLANTEGNAPLVISAGQSDNDWDYPVHVMRHEKTLGFIPRETIRGVASNRLLIAKYKNKEVGYLLWSIRMDKSEVKIQQLFVEDQYRYRGIGRMLVGAVQALNPNALTTCKVREDLTANVFWVEIGFAPVRTIMHKTSGNPLRCYKMNPRTPLGYEPGEV